MVPGNHDHALVEAWTGRRDESPDPDAPLRSSASPPPRPLRCWRTLASWAAPARLDVAFPGLWLRPDVYATHGHYLDCHLTIPTMERLGIAMTARALRRPAEDFAAVGDYESVTAPVFAWIDAVARQAPTGDSLNGQSTVRVWRALAGDRSKNGRGWGDLRLRALAGAFPFAIAALNRAGLGSYNADISTDELRRAGLRAMGEVASRLGLGDAHVIFGHTHRRGPLSGDTPAEWLGPSGARLFNAGCWTYDNYFVRGGPGESPYWPGGAVLVDDDGPPELLRLLDGQSNEDLKPVPA